MKRTALALALALTTATTLALDIPDRSRYDGRIRYAVYNPGDVVQLDTCIGMAMRIELEPGETYADHAFGDPHAWMARTHQNHFTIRPGSADNANSIPPADMQADTNLLLITNKRAYSFKVSYSGTRNCRPYYALIFRYPDSEARQAQAAADKANLEATFAAGTGRVNLDYSMSGNRESVAALAPINAWDDGVHTYFRFAPGQELPTVYVAGPDGETLVNRHMHDPLTIVAQRIAHKWTLRIGDLALRIWNRRPDLAVETGTGTVSPWIERRVKGEDDGN
jgi:type IV secretion system protein VirB9